MLWKDKSFVECKRFVIVLLVIWNTITFSLVSRPTCITLIIKPAITKE